MSLLDKYNEWSGRGAHQASGNAKEAGSFAVNFMRDLYAKGFTLRQKQGETDFDLEKVRSGAIPSSQMSSRKYDDSKTYGDSMTDK